ncbi:MULTISPECIES: ABC transporter permease [Arthrobacter]|uniref:ABC transporter permease n=1 Tax=Arthrobacter psychrochitiniphilus TaxID=291045 RepID=A0A2V3DSJ4_9MICC|nr:ABC transporter permease [Arthrobacter psychrochitiniphilus]NYG17868.1 peptide/nickel transport system permease protein [Arthrobacter psychrochitiniphilus]PXA65104.1 ABC transporter permease [Arthrobacter psychrochitiniphilus]
MTLTATLLPGLSKRRYGSMFSTVGWAAVVVALTVVLLSVLAPFIAPYDPNYVDLENVLSGPSLAHWLGTDAMGRDLLSRLMFGGRTSLVGPLIVVVASTIFGLLLGLAAGWSDGWISALLSRIFDLVFAFPALLLSMLAIALFGKGLVAPIIAMTISYIPYVARLTQQLVISERSRPYVQAYRVLGFRTSWVVLGRVLPNLVPTVGAQSTLNFGYVLADLAALSFIGLGIQPPTSDWGAMIEEARGALLSGSLMPALLPALVVVLIVVSINVIGEELSDRIGGNLS